jgi:hypothetical protein
MFGFIFVRDVLNHCEVEVSLRELVRVGKPGALVLVDELYTHSMLQGLRKSVLGRWIYPKVLPSIYPDQNPYITEDERKLSARELLLIRSTLRDARCEYFNMVVNRFIPDWDALEMVDRVTLKVLGKFGYLLAGRFVLLGCVGK